MTKPEEKKGHEIPEKDFLFILNTLHQIGTSKHISREKMAENAMRAFKRFAKHDTYDSF